MCTCNVNSDCMCSFVLLVCFQFVVDGVLISVHYSCNDWQAILKETREMTDVLAKCSLNTDSQTNKKKGRTPCTFSRIDWNRNSWLADTHRDRRNNKHESLCYLHKFFSLAHQNKIIRKHTTFIIRTKTNKKIYFLRQSLIYPQLA